MAWMASRIASCCSSLLASSIVLADPPPGETPPPVSCGRRAPLKLGAIEDGHFVGEVPMKKPKNGDPGRWAHQVVVTISDGELSTKEMPLVYRRGERYQSASDGGFYRFEGCLVSENDHYRAERRLMRAEYAEAGAVLNKAVSIKPRGASIEVNGTHYRRVANPETW